MGEFHPLSMQHEKPSSIRPIVAFADKEEVLVENGKMTVLHGSPWSPASKWSELSRQYFQKRYLCFWVLAALLPFILLRLTFFYNDTVLFLRPGAGSRTSQESAQQLVLPSPAGSSSGGVVSITPGPELPKTINAGDTDSDADADAEAQRQAMITQEDSQIRPDEDAWRTHDESIIHAESPRGIGRNDAPDVGKNSTVEKREEGGAVPIKPMENTTTSNSAAVVCDLFDGDWVSDPEEPLYTNSSCLQIQGHQNCMRNGRPDRDYLYWKWKPRECELPRFDASSFLNKFRGKAIGFVGDSLARNQMQSLLCMLSQVEMPVETYQTEDDRTVRWLYKEHQVTVGSVWSPYLLKESHDGVLGFEKGESLLYFDVLDDEWTSVLSDFDIVVLSIGQWFFKGSIYVKQNEVIGCHYCPGHNITDHGFYDAYRTAVREVLEKVVADFKGIAVMSTFAISHFEGGEWDSGGECRRQQPLNAEEGINFPGLHHEMRDIVMSEYNRIAGDKERMRAAAAADLHLEFLDVTKLSLRRADGHPGAYRVPNPYEGKDPSQWVQNDCLHWCLPGPADTWNQLLVELSDRHL